MEPYESHIEMNRKHFSASAAGPNHLRPVNRLLRCLGKPTAMCDPTHFREYTMPELAALVANAGFQLQRQSGMMPLDTNITYLLMKRCIPHKYYKRVMESALSIHLGHLIKSLAIVQLLVARKGS